ncbi:N-methylhydantoinase B [Nocardia amikacinitolerans]|uniref:N-methylhydantoinase B n=1 Tax=Nocardia amikacinitolerans TaxID=756689 RepID=A0A285KYJ4_9NOCA|nr:hydantoinase B/oxoprolinase family protein [Nocardia amikacinitolerans]MCP2276253.1 N-methylhydantoinase B [Nocardia amikacinitolerans]MCP2294518.1 N-methylhydantoinase B [Nocardia amikacinitolerans]SNY77720.1 N-methylhydantoinase B [Nocardia amikacinitolerans]
MTTIETSGTAVDVELDILRHGLIEVAREMLDSLMRSAFSPVCRDILDCTSAIHMRTDDGWETVALWEGCMQHAFTAPHIANFVMDDWDIDTMQPGDVIFVNDPWRGTIHQSDVNLLRPVFVNDRVEFLLHSTSHLVDLGGAIPGGFSNGTQTHFEEQLKLPPTLLYANDVPVRPTFNFILENNRVPQLVLGDLRALHGCLVVGERQLRELVARSGLDKIRAAGRYAIESTEASMRRGIASIPDGDYTAEDFLDEDGVSDEAIPVHVTVKVRGDSMEIDFSGSGRQPLGNCGTAWCEATRCIEAVKLMVDPSTPVNSGTLRPVETILPPGSVVQVLPPSSCSNHADIGARGINVVTQALSQATDEAFACDTGTAVVVSLGGIDTRAGHEGTPWGAFALAGGGWGGTWTEDGVSFCVIPIGNCRTSVQEHLEIESPLVVVQHEMVIDTAGAGRYRGGAGSVYSIYAESDTMVTVTADRIRVGAPGSNGGGAGAPAFGWYIEDFDLARHGDPLDLRGVEPLFGMFDAEGRPDPNHGEFGRGARYQTGKFSGLILKAGDALRFVIGGGGGWGDPLEREPARVAADVRAGLVSPEFAAAGYGVVLVGGEVDEAATSAQRAHLVTERAEGRWQVPVATPLTWTL